MINLYYNYYIDKLDERNDELEFCFNRNIENCNIDYIYVFLEEKDYDIFIGKYKHVKKIKINIIKERPTYETFFKYSNIVTKKTDINVLMNSDCYINIEDTNKLKTMNDNDFLCLSRWNIESLDPLKLNDNEIIDVSQDCWIWKGIIKEMKSDFKLGVKACDNAIAYQINKSGYDIINCPYDIRIYHYHFTYQNRIKDTWNLFNYDKENILFVEVSKYKNDKKTQSIKEICENLIINNNIIISNENITIYSSLTQSKNDIKFEDDNIVINGEKFSYRGLKIKKIK